MRVFNLLLPWEPATIACFTDLHIDAPDHDRDLLLRDLEKAKKLNARILIGSEIFSNILPKDLKRYTRGRDRHNIDAPINRAVKEAVDTLAPYVNLIDGIGIGNHDTAIIKYHGFDPALSVIERLMMKRDDNLPRIIHMGYTGMFQIVFENGHHRAKDIWWYHHGKGGGAPVTKGMIDINRICQSWFADVYWLGHKHTSISDNSLRMGYLNKEGTLETKQRVAFYTAGYKGKLEPAEYDKDGYILNWGEENFYGLEGQGNALVRYTPIYTGTGRANDVLERETIKRN